MHTLATSPRFAVATYDALTANIAILNSAGEIIAVNRAWVRFAEAFGGQDDIGQNYLEVCEQTQGEERAMAISIAEGIRAVLQDPEAVTETEYPCALPDGMHYFLARVTGFVQDGAAYAVVAHQDITRRKRAELEVHDLNRHLEERVAERTQALQLTEQRLEAHNAELERIQTELGRKNAALEERNLELAQFTYVASHDLQEPLRILGIYNDLLQHRYAETFDERGQSYLAHMAEQVRRARQLVRDVLTFSNISAASSASSEPTDVLPIWQESAGMLDWPADAQYSCLAALPVQMHPAQLRQLLSNLLTNAIKFRTERPLRVTLTARRDGKWLEFRLCDNGVGIAAEQLDKVFLMFQRLQTRAATEGNGIGLAVCKKIVERQGGRIWLESRSGEGTCVVFTLPAAEPEGPQTSTT